MFQDGFTEVESCTGADHEECIFNYQKNGECLRLATEGEYLPSAGYGLPILVRWSHDCPD
jgi:hypothetical protein